MAVMSNVLFAENLSSLLEPLFVLLPATIIAVVLLWRAYAKVSKADAEYRGAKGIIQALVENFTNRMKAQNLRIEEALNAAQMASSVASSAYERAQGQTEYISSLQNGMETSLKAQTVIAKNLVTLKEKLLEVVGRHEELQKQIKSLDDRYRGLLPEVEKPVVLPVEGEIALSRLTPTEMHILEILTAEGSKPAPELRNVIGKTREHTARLMKKLFSEGYVERESGTLPYRYKVNEKIKPTIEQVIKKRIAARSQEGVVPDFKSPTDT